MKTIQITEMDNVAVALHPIAKGEHIQTGGQMIEAAQDIPQGHKIALKPIAKGENVIKYGFPIGHATQDAAPGEWIHTHNMATNLEGEITYSYEPDIHDLKTEQPEYFQGFRRKDGRAAIRNEIWVIPTVGCVNVFAGYIVK